MITALLAFLNLLSFIKPYSQSILLLQVMEGIQFFVKSSSEGACHEQAFKSSTLFGCAEVV